MRGAVYLLQAGIFLQDTEAITSAALWIARMIRKAIRPSFVKFSHENDLLFPSYHSIMISESPSLNDLTTQLVDIQQIEAAEIARHLSLVEVLVFAKSSKHAHLLEVFQGLGLLSGAVDIAQQLHSGTPKFTRELLEASVPKSSLCGRGAIQELHLPVRCFTDTNIKPLEPIQGHLSALHTLSVTHSFMLASTSQHMKAPFTDFLTSLAQNSSLRSLSFTIPDLAYKAKRLVDDKQIQRLVKAVQSLTTLTALNLSADFIALDSRPEFLTAFPALVHLRLRPRGLVSDHVRFRSHA
jgi:hypothetical protein